MRFGAIENGKLALGAEKAPTSVSLFNQGLIQVLQAAVTGLQPNQPYVLALAQASRRQGHAGAAGIWFMTNPAGSAIVNATGPIRQVVQGEDKIPRRYLVIAPGTTAGARQAGATANSLNGFGENIVGSGWTDHA